MKHLVYDVNFFDIVHKITEIELFPELVLLQNGFKCTSVLKIHFMVLRIPHTHV